MSLKEFIRRYDEQPFEWIHGEISTVSPSVFGPTYLANRLAGYLNRHAEPLNLGEAFIEAVFVLGDDAQWVKGSRVPDVMYISADRLASYKAENPHWQSEPLRLVPDLVVEVISPTDSFAKLKHKVRTYQDDGVSLIWVIDPERRTISIALPDSPQFAVLTDGDTLTAEEVLPGFRLEVSNYFG